MEDFIMLIVESELNEIKKRANEIYSEIIMDKTLRQVSERDGGGAYCITNNLPLINIIEFNRAHNKIEIKQ
ncbi:MAG: hypothetical protein HC831_19165 [Chloroflexia bacterium]|nr:hypothetical protein [Bacteroidales bacterium]NJO90845.1 hypothetical protein [Chloroflexia bacterium]